MSETPEKNQGELNREALDVSRHPYASWSEAAQGLHDRLKALESKFDGLTNAKPSRASDGFRLQEVSKEIEKIKA